VVGGIWEDAGGEQQGGEGTEDVVVVVVVMVADWGRGIVVGAKEGMDGVVGYVAEDGQCV
jgi:hypothetical protein